MKTSMQILQCEMKTVVDTYVRLKRLCKSTRNGGVNNKIKQLLVYWVCNGMFGKYMEITAFKKYSFLSYYVYMCAPTTTKNSK